MRFYNLATASLMLGSACVLYGFNYDTRLIETNVRSLERRVEIAHNDIALLKAEKAHLSRPGRVDTYARQLGLEPVRPNQILQVPSSQMRLLSEMN